MKRVVDQNTRMQNQIHERKSKYTNAKRNTRTQNPILKQ